ADSGPDYMETEGRANAVGPKAVAMGGTLQAWCETLARFGTFSLADVTEPAIRHASRGYRVTPFLCECAADVAADLARDREIARLYLPDGQPIKPGTRLVQGAYAETLRLVAREGAAALTEGSLGRTLTHHLRKAGGLVSAEDLAQYRVIERAPVRGNYRGVEIIRPPPPSAGGVHVIQMLNILEGYDVTGLGFGSVEMVHLLAEAMKIAFADRAASTGDPAFVSVPVERLLSKAYAEDCRRR